MRRLERKWRTNSGASWPKRLEWLEIKNIRGWEEQRIDFDFPIVAIVGENGSGKSTILQSAACSFRNQGGANYFPTEFFPETAWDSLNDAAIRVGIKQGPNHSNHSIRKPSTRWLGQPERPLRPVRYLDLSRLQPVGTRVGYARIAKTRHNEAHAVNFDEQQIHRMSAIMGRTYNDAKMAKTSIDPNRDIPVLTKEHRPYSGFHQGSGETTVAELLQTDLPKHGLVLIDEIESSLHPRAQRRLMRDLATVTRTQECQVVITTHSPYILEELPLEARIYILENAGEKTIARGVSPQFAMTKMDDENYPEVEVFVEDDRAKIWLESILSVHHQDVVQKVSIIPFGSANLGVALGQITSQGRFPRPTVVFLDGDQDDATGCSLLPGDDAPEVVVFERLKRENWSDLWTRVARDLSYVADACSKSMTSLDHHSWVNQAASELLLSGDFLWQCMCLEWAKTVRPRDTQYIRDDIQDALRTI
ncbi:ATP-dependent nuclease [Candidatus Rhodobacter oscarellae]|nr:AAA family ATPase [Candidatus Rhodobacter lobularis]